MKQPTLPQRQNTGAPRTPLAVGESVSHPIGHARIAVTRTQDNAWTVFVYHAGSNQQVDELRSGPWPSEERAREVASNGYRAFATGRTVQQVIDAIAEGARYDRAQALNRRDVRAVAALDVVLDRLTSADEWDADERMLAGIRQNMRVAAERDRPLSGFGQLQLAHARAAEADRAGRTGCAA